MRPAIEPATVPCPVCGGDCRSALECRERGVPLGRRGDELPITLTPLGWAMSKLGRDPRKDR